MPTDQELENLVNNCDWEWTTQNGVSGCVVKGKGAYASASIFLPAAGNGDGGAFYGGGSAGRFWSSVPGSGEFNAWLLSFYSGYHSTYSSGAYRWLLQSIRPVQDAE